jgi:hypothetical protein
VTGTTIAEVKFFFFFFLVDRNLILLTSSALYHIPGTIPLLGFVYVSIFHGTRPCTIYLVQ